MRPRRAALLFALAAAVAFATACSGSGASGGSAVPPLSVSTVGHTYVLEERQYALTLQATGGLPPYAWTATNLPSGSEISSAGVLSGVTPAKLNFGGPTDEYQINLQVRNSGTPSRTATGVFLLNVVRRLSILNNNLKSPNVGISYFQRIDFEGGHGLRTWRLVEGAGALPPGLTLSSDGHLSGRPSAPGMFNFAVEISDLGPPAQSASRAVSLVVTNNLVIVDTSWVLPTGVVTKPYRATLEAAGGTPPYSWIGHQMPPGLVFEDSLAGVVGGIPTQPNPDAIAFIEVRDSSQEQQSDARNVRIPIQLVLALHSATFDDAVVGVLYFQWLPLEGGISPYFYELVAGSLPPGITFPFGTYSGIGRFKGAASDSGAWNFTIRVADAETPPDTVQQAFGIRVNPRLIFGPPLPLPNGLVGEAYSFQFQATGGLLPLQWSASYCCPMGLTFDSQIGLLAGIASAATETSGAHLHIRVQDSGNPPQISDVSRLLVILDTLKIITSDFPAIVPGAEVSLQLGASGGIGQYTWSQLASGLPSGLTFGPSTGAITGQTSQAGTFDLTVQVSDPGPPAQTSDPVTLQLTVAGNLGRNSSPATATPLSNGTYRASISPLADPPTGVANSDSDYYVLTANPGATVTVEITAQRLTPPSPLDSVLEIVNEANNRLSFCSSRPTHPLNQSCVHDDLLLGVSTDSKLNLKVPDANPGPLTFYAHVLDWRGDARPDLLYTITVSGAN